MGSIGPIGGGIVLITVQQTTFFLCSAQDQALFTSLDRLFLTFPTSLFSGVIFIPSDSYGRRRSIGGRDSS